MAKARNIYGGAMNISMLPRFSRMGQQRLALGRNTTGLATATTITSASPAPAACSCQGMPDPAAPALTPPVGVQLSAEVPYYTTTPRSAIIALNYAGEPFAIDAVDGAGQIVRLLTTNAPREDNVIEAWDTLRGIVTNVRLVNLS